MAVFRMQNWGGLSGFLKKLSSVSTGLNEALVIFFWYSSNFFQKHSLHKVSMYIVAFSGHPKFIPGHCSIDCSGVHCSAKKKERSDNLNELLPLP